MGITNKAYFTLEETVRRWQVPHRDVAYLAENGLLHLSVRVFDIQLEHGTCETGGDGSCQHVPYERPVFSGVQDLRERDVFHLFRTGRIDVAWFHAPTSEYVHIIPPSAPLTVHIDDLLVRREERDRVEGLFGLTPNGADPAGRIRPNADYSEVRMEGLVFRLGPIQARIVGRLHAAALAGSPWVSGKAVLRAAGSSCTRMADAFKSQAEWRLLIDSDRRGRYRLRLPSP